MKLPSPSSDEVWNAWSYTSTRIHIMVFNSVSTETTLPLRKSQRKFKQISYPVHFFPQLHITAFEIVKLKWINVPEVLTAVTVKGADRLLRSNAM